MTILRKLFLALALLAALPGPAIAAASYFADNVQMTVSGTPGTGTITLGSAVSGHQSASTATIPNGSQVSYYAADTGAIWEIGHGTYNSSAGTVTRGALWGSSGPSTAVSLTSSAVVSIVSIGEDFGPLAQSSAGVGLAIVSGALNLQPGTASVIGGVESIAAVSHEFVTSIVAGVPFLGQPSFADISGLLDLATQVSGTLGVGSGGTGATSMPSQVFPMGSGTGAYVASSCGDNGVAYCNHPFSIITNPLLEFQTAGAAITANTLLKLDNTGRAVPTSTSDIDGVIGIASGSVTLGSTFETAFAGRQNCVFDGATTAGDWVTISSTVAGDCHDTGSATRAIGQFQIGQVLSTNVSGGTYAINIDNQFTPASLSPGGSTGAVQWNNAGVFAGTSVVSNDVIVGGGAGGPQDSGILASNITLLSANQAISGNKTFTGISTFGEVIGSVSYQVGTTYTFSTTDCGTEVIFGSSSAVTATIPATLPIGCNIAILQSGAGKVSVNGSAVAPATLESSSSYTATSKTWAIIGINIAGNTGGSAAIAVLTGDGS